MKVLVTDYAWKSLDIEKDILQRVGASIVAAPTGEEDELAELATDVDAILTCWKSVTKKVIQSAPRCLTIGRYGIGLDNIDVAFATSVGIVVTNVPTYCVEEVSDHAMALLLAQARKAAFYDRSIKGGRYNLRSGTPLFRIAGKTLGIAGFGKIGQAVYRKARGFGLNVCVYDPYVNDGVLSAYQVQQVSFQDLLKASDYITIHMPLTPETQHFFNYEAFLQMKRTAFLINTSRGDIIEPEGLLRALNEGLLAGAGLDVLSKEPPDPADSLILHPKTVITPHAAFNSEESLAELQRSAAEQAASVMAGKLPPHVVNPGVLEQSNLRAIFKDTGSGTPSR